MKSLDHMEFESQSQTKQDYMRRTGNDWYGKKILAWILQKIFLLKPNTLVKFGFHFQILSSMYHIYPIIIDAGMESKLEIFLDNIQEIHLVE